MLVFSSPNSRTISLICSLGLLSLAGFWAFGPKKTPSQPQAALTAGWAWHAPVPEEIPPGFMEFRGKLAPLEVPNGLDMLVNPSFDETPPPAAGEFILNRQISQPGWNFLNKTARGAITAALSQGQRDWKFMVLHSSATASGSARAFDYYHRYVRGMQHGLAYHFVITNGRGGPDGQIQIGPRWMDQLAGGHLRSDAQNEVAIGICFVGDFQKNSPTRNQLLAADELIDYLQAKLGKLPVTTHRKVNIRPTLCPGKFFPSGLFIEGKVPE
jgi:hypothetical protein